MNDQQNPEAATSVAIIGMAGRFPGASTVEDFWRNISHGTESITTFTDDELRAAGVSEADLADPRYVKAGAVLDGIEMFDAGFFGLTPRDAQIIDPQQRIFLETAWTALEAAGCDPARTDGTIGVFAGSALSTYLLRNLQHNPEVVSASGDLQLILRNDKDSLATWTAYALDLQGPSYTIQSYCSTSLVAVAAACSSLIAGECDAALAGGVAISVPHRVGYSYQEGGIASPDGKCRAFDEQAQGAPLGNGVGVVVLKRLTDAIAGGDHIHAVIRGWAVNNDGGLKVGFTAPGIRGQSAVISEAMANAGVEPASIDYVETHGTGTPLGDAVEFAAMSRAFTGVPAQSCAIGSVKTNVGHLDRAAGVTGLIKTASALENATLPATLHYQRANPQIPLDDSPFRVQTERGDWPRGEHPRRAGVSAFGIGGTNAHVVLEEAPPCELDPPRPRPRLLLFSARTEPAVQQRVLDFGSRLAGNSDDELADMAYTLQVGRAEFEHRRAAVVTDRSDALSVLCTNESGRLLGSGSVVGGRGVGVVFAGVGEQYVGWTAGLYESEPVFRAVVDECAVVVESLVGVDLRRVLFAGESGLGGVGVDLRSMVGRGAGSSVGGVSGLLASTVVAQPAVFVVEYALARLLQSWGVRPAVLAGYSVGEYVAATVAGVMSWRDALSLVAFRARLIDRCPAGAMTAVSLPVARLRPLLGSGVDVAAVNAPGLCVMSGPVSDVAEVERGLAAAQVAYRRLDTGHAFHSRMLLPVAQELTDWIRVNVRLAVPKIPYLSNVTGSWVRDDQALDPGYWAEHMCGPVRFADAAAELLADPDRVIVEIGPGQTLGAFIRQQPSCGASRMGLIIPTLPGQHEHVDSAETLHTAVARLWLAGVGIDWAGYHAGEARRRVPLPTYPFQRQRYWIDPPTTKRVPVSAAPRAEPDMAEGAGLQDILSALPRREIADWFYLPGWRQSAPPPPVDTAPDGLWLVFADGTGVGEALLDRLAGRGVRTVAVRPGADFAADRDGFVLRPGEQSHYARLLDAMGIDRTTRLTVVHLWSLDQAPIQAVGSASADPALDRSYFSLLWLAQALGSARLVGGLVLAASSGAYNVSGSDQIRPENATITGPCKIIPLEFAHLQCRQIDLQAPSGPGDAIALAEVLYREASADRTQTLVAWRAGRRWLPTFEPIAIGSDEAGLGMLTDRGVYLVTGGLGGIGGSIAQHLAKSVSARLVLVGRTEYPAREQWATLAADASTPVDVARGIQKVLDLEAAGAEVLLIGADVCDAGQFRAALERAREHFGRIDGVIHAAGVPGMGLLQFKSADNAAIALGPKVNGTRVIMDCLAEHAPDFVVLFSSITSVTGGGPGQVDYCAANAYLDAVAQQMGRHGPRVLSIDWGEWRWNAWGAGLSGYAPEIQRFFEANRRRFGIGFDEGWSALLRALGSGQSQLVVSTQDFGELAELSRTFTVDTVLSLGQATHGRHDRPELSTSYVAPGSDVERLIATVWCDCLGLDKVGVNDNFFELGGNSLLGVDLIARICRELDREPLAPHVLYLAPSVAALAELVSGPDESAWVDERRERGALRRQNLRKRRAR